MDEPKFFSNQDSLKLLTFESATQKEHRDDEQDGRQEFIRCIIYYYLQKSCLFFEVYMCKHETCPDCYLGKEVSMGRI